jgi:D-alanine-D-alanine ligase-like ATP-grasp enzyme
LLKEGYPPIVIDFDEKQLYYDYFQYYHNTGRADKMVKLINENIEREIKRYME